MATLIMQRYALQPDPLQLNPDLQEWVCAFIKKGMAKDPAQRFDSLRTFGDALRKRSTFAYQEESTVHVPQDESKETA